MEGDEIYIKKYFGNELKIDRKKKYIIKEIHSRKESKLIVILKPNICFPIEEYGEVYAEKIERSTYFCCI
jgi:hypothetical protein|tara:strand:- start:191 stop:400 length:210 start_codon:yes stop_codon:yes gene_type:complete